MVRLAVMRLDKGEADDPMRWQRGMVVDALPYYQHLGDGVEPQLSDTFAIVDVTDADREDVADLLEPLDVDDVLDVGGEVCHVFTPHGRRRVRINLDAIPAAWIRLIEAGYPVEVSTAQLAPYVEDLT